MKRFVHTFTFSILALFLCSLSYGVDLTLKTEIENLYDEYEKSVATTDPEKILSYYAEDFRAIGSMGGREEIEMVMTKLCENFEGIKVKIDISEIKQVEEKVVVLGDFYLEGKKDGKWNKIADDGFIDTLKKIDGEWKYVSSGNVDQDRMSNIKGNVYQNEEIGYSMTSPNGWKVLPIQGPRMKDCLMFMDDEGHAPGFFGYVEVPYNAKAKEAVLGDDSVMRKMAEISSFKTESMKPVKVKGNTGFESVTSFTIDGEGLRRKRVYFDAGGLLYVFVLTTPQEHFDSVIAPFDQLMNSFELSEAAQKSGAEIARSKQGSGEVQGRVYTNQELGCQIAAPKGWSILSTPIQGFNISVSLTPKEGDSTVRLLAQKAGSLIAEKDTEMIFEREMEGVKKLVGNFEMHSGISDIEINGVKGKEALISFEIEGFGAMKRREIMFVKNGVLYLILCDAKPSSEYEKMKPKFNEVVNSFTVN